MQLCGTIIYSKISLQSYYGSYVLNTLWWNPELIKKREINDNVVKVSIRANVVVRTFWFEKNVLWWKMKTWEARKFKRNFEDISCQ